MIDTYHKETLLEKVAPYLMGIVFITVALIIANEALGNPLLDYFTK